MRTLRILSLLALLLVSLSAQAQDNPITIESRSFVVNTLSSDDGSREELVEAGEAIPGQVIEYQLTVRNDGATVLPASAVSLYGPVPTGTRAVEDSGSSEAGLQTEYLETDDYVGWRWTILEPFEPGETMLLRYRVIME